MDNEQSGLSPSTPPDAREVAQELREVVESIVVQQMRAKIKRTFFMWGVGGGLLVAATFSVVGFILNQFYVLQKAQRATDVQQLVERAENAATRAEGYSNEAKLSSDNVTRDMRSTLEAQNVCTLAADSSQTSASTAAQAVIDAKEFANQASESVRLCGNAAQAAENAHQSAVDQANRATAAASKAQEHESKSLESVRLARQSADQASQSVTSSSSHARDARRSEQTAANAADRISDSLDLLHRHERIFNGEETARRIRARRFDAVYGSGDMRASLVANQHSANITLTLGGGHTAYMEVAETPAGVPARALVGLRLREGDDYKLFRVP